ncbi:MAG: hypothetical protein IOC86_01570 [Aestuariivirga sp.]|nr:hypothetical protein [Aestuariivirga sp.]
MAMSPGSRRPDAPLNPAEGNPMQEPLGSMDRPIPRTSDDNDMNLASNGAGRRAGNLGRTGSAGARGRGFTTTFAVVAAILVAAFLVALYLGSERYNQATAPSDSQAPVADTTPGAAPAGDTTGSTTPAAPGSGTGAPPPANP